MSARVIAAARIASFRFAFLFALHLAAPPAPAADLSKVFDAALGGDMVAALALIDSIPAARLSPKDSATADCLTRTFRSPPTSEDLPPRSGAILAAYRNYWQSVLLRRTTTAEAESRLLSDLNAVVGAAAADTTGAGGLEAASEQAKATIESEGLHALTGVTSPFWELMIWKVHTPTTYKVTLTDQTLDVRVVFLDDFVSLGWAAYATCGRAHTGGWATSEELYALKSSYVLDSEDFRVSYLAHEGRHFADYKRFPKLEQPELEYRAKLTEIALSDTTTHSLISNFSRRTLRDRSVPHSFANYCVARDMAKAVFGGAAGTRADEGAGDPARWAGVPAERLRREARKLLSESDARLKRLGAAKTERYLDAGEE
ncbi:MAG TPA: hypothetical protein VFM17_07505 [Candidatus Eisenbacteria bacterium]|nr:hypothetical protein [Candidatus Eisenbacteria bacterium]